MRINERELIHLNVGGNRRAELPPHSELQNLGRVAWLVMVAVALLPSPAWAQNLFFDVDPNTAPIDGGAANWSDLDWKTSAGATTGVGWTASSTAIFDPITGTPGPTTITLGGTETATAVTFNGAGYTLTGGTLALAGTDSTNWINVNATGTIQSALTHMRFKGTGEVTISGGGTTTTRGVIGDGASGLVTVRQTGGTFTIGNNEYFMVGGNNVADSQGAYIMDAGSLTIAQGIYLGWGGAGRTGSFTQNGGTVTTQSGQGIQIGIGGGTGAYTLNGGTLISGFGEFGTPYSGSFTFGGGTLQTNMSFNTNRQAGVTTSIAAGATARINTNGATVTWSTALTGASAAGLSKSGTGTLTLSGANSYAGGTTVTGGALVLGNASALGNTTGTLTLARTNVFDDGTKTSLDLRGFSLSNPIVVAASNPGVNDAGVLQNTAVGTTSVLSGTVSLGGENYVGGNGDIRLEGVVSGGASGGYTLYKQGTGTWTFANEANTFDGFYYLIGGTTAVTKLANVNEASSLGRPTNSTANRVSFGFSGGGGGTLQYIGSSASTSDRVFVLSGDPATAARIDADGAGSAATLTLTGSLSANRSGGYTAALGGANAGVNTYSGAISNGSGTVSLLKDGTTSWALAGTNAYSGTTTVSAGTLLINGDNAAATGAVSVAALATLGGSGTVGGATTVSGTHSPGTSPGLQAFTNGLSYTTTGTLVWELSANTAVSADRGTLYDGIDLTTAGALAIDPAATLSLVFNQPLANSTPSTVDWNNAFWSSDQQWVIADLSSGVTWDGTVFGTVSVGVDSLGNALTVVRPNASFSLANSGGDLVLSYSSVPEPGTWALLAAAAAGVLGLRHCRRATKTR